MRPSPCYNHGEGCDKRNADCHSICKDYIDWRKELDEANIKRNEYEAARSDSIKQYARYKRRYK